MLNAILDMLIVRQFQHYKHNNKHTRNSQVEQNIGLIESTNLIARKQI